VRGSRLSTRTIAAVAVAALSATGLAACGDDSGGGSSDKSIVVWTSVDQPILDGLQKGIDPLAKTAGITIKLQRVDNINQVIMTKLNAKDKPDIAMIPQPGVVADIVKRGAAKPLDDVLDKAALEGSMVPGALDAGTVDDKLYALLVNANIKSLVFYPKKAWDAAGYEAPDSIDALNALTDQIKGDGNTPWCMGVESDAATGWPATDWFEDLVMRYGGADGYNSWVTHETPFDSDVVRQSAAEFEKLFFTDGNVLGGRKAIVSTNFGTAGNPMFDKKPGCFMYKQGSFITGFFPKNIQADLDGEVGVFGFPPATAGGENPVLGGGDLAVMLNDSDAAKEAMKILANKDIGVPAATGGSSFLSPFKDFDVSNYQGELKKAFADVAYKATAFLFDGSDQMPGAVGAGTFWKDMTAWIAGDEDLDTALKNIDNSWPS